MGVYSSRVYACTRVARGRLTVGAWMPGSFAAGPRYHVAGHHAPALVCLGCNPYGVALSRRERVTLRPLRKRFLGLLLDRLRFRPGQHSRPGFLAISAAGSSGWRIRGDELHRPGRAVRRMISGYLPGSATQRRGPSGQAGHLLDGATDPPSHAYTHAPRMQPLRGCFYRDARKGAIRYSLTRRRDPWC